MIKRAVNDIHYNDVKAIFTNAVFSWYIFGIHSKKYHLRQEKNQLQKNVVIKVKSRRNKSWKMVRWCVGALVLDGVPRKQSAMRQIFHWLLLSLMSNDLIMDWFHNIFWHTDHTLMRMRLRIPSVHNENKSTLHINWYLPTIKNWQKVTHHVGTTTKFILKIFATQAKDV